MISIFRSLKKRGVKNTFLIVVCHCIDYYFDLKYKTDTFSWVELDDLNIDNSKKKHAEMYQQTYAVPLKELFSKLRFTPDKIFVDFGSGKGRVLLIAAQSGFNEVRGVEISPVLCDIATKNITIYKKATQNKTDFIVVNSDIVDYKFDDKEQVFFLFNPFDAHVTKQVVENILESLQRKKRKIWIIYRNARYRNIFEQYLNIEVVLEFVIWGLDFVVYETKHSS